MDYFKYFRGMEYGMPNTNSPYNFQGFGNNLNVPTNTPWPLDFQDKSVQYNLNKLIASVKDSVGNEAKDEMEYNQLAKMAPNEEQKNLINTIKENEMIHNKIFRKIFTELTGVVLPLSNVTNMPEEKTNMNYVEMLTSAMLGELKAVERYREMLAYAPNKCIYDMIMYVMTDEICHAIKYNYLLLLNKQ